MGTFILIIYNAFLLSANIRIKELSILKSLGATPKQIKYSVIYKGFLLWIIQLPIGLIVGIE
ncbi:MULTISPECIES: FtsX-like permease family protein [Clostridium]|uniref:FtsX-like permease family protein n=1 Tax=Clostridium TaxID=1485 RepID=UPI000ACA178A|nr:MULTISPECIES: FtsX-like permease family protein [Clostridium]